MAIKYTEEQLNTVDKSFLIHLLLQQQERFGRSSEKLEDAGQICFREENGTIVFLMKQKLYALLMLLNLKH